jgi:hypothetical protein
MTELLCRLRAAYAVPRTRNQRGDVPGWVLITVMTAGLVAGLMAVAGPELEQLLRDALNSVTG